MKDEVLEEIIEEIMRCYHMNNYDDYSNEELREQYRQMLANGKPIERIENNGSSKNV